jgi:hypothetical protein
MTLKTLSLMALAVPLTVASWSAASAGQQAGQSSDQSRIERQTGQSNEMGMPTPGSVQDQEPTRKHRKPERDSTHEKRSQATLSSAKYFVYGDVLRIDGDNYFVRDNDSGDEVRLIVNTDTNLDCSAKPGTQEGMTSGGKRQHEEGVSDRQRAQGQRKDETASGSGFAVGKCNFQAGDKVKAEVSDVGTVTTLKFVRDTEPGSAGSFRSQVPQQPGTVTPRDSQSRSPAIDKVPGMKEDMAGSEAPGDLRGDEESGTRGRQ